VETVPCSLKSLDEAENKNIMQCGCCTEDNQGTSNAMGYVQPNSISALKMLVRDMHIMEEEIENCMQNSCWTKDNQATSNAMEYVHGSECNEAECKHADMHNKSTFQRS
jgi:hypothetical protein